MASQKTRRKIVETFLELVGERGWGGFEMAELAERAGVKLSALRAEFPDKIHCYKAFLSQVDQTVLDGIDPSMKDEPARDRLFDVLMARLDALEPSKPALRALSRDVRRDPQLALAFNGESARSQRWMLTAAGIPASGFRARMIAQGLVLGFARVVDVWLDDEDPGLAKTMAALDRQLDEGETWIGRADRLGSFLKPLFRAAGATRRGATGKAETSASAPPSSDEPGSAPA
jgi:AcrR family transcriptional regulator